MKFSDFLAGLTPSEQDTIKTRLNLIAGHTGATRQFVFNLEGHEHRLSAAAWETIKTALLGANDFNALIEAIISACQKCCLQGGSLPHPVPMRFGRAVTKTRFRDHLRRECADLTEDQIKWLMVRPDRLTKQLEDTYLARYGMWATFSEANSSGDPFAALPDQARGIRICLGLDRTDKDDMILLDYTLPAGIEPLYPTIADAYAAQPWPAQFRPARDSDRCGRTMPLPDDPDAAPQPEVIHQRITGATLQRPIRIAKERSK